VVDNLNSKASDFGVLGRNAPENAWRVIFWDERRDRRQKIMEIISAAGAQPVAIESLSDLRLAKFFARCCVTVVFTGAIPGGVGMQVIRHLKAKGINVVACEDGADFWPIKTRCLPLLAGAVQMLDSASAEFGRELHQAIEGIVRAEAQNRSEEQGIGEIMRGLGMIGVSAGMMAVFRSVIRFSALSDLPVIITGETGTGKEGVARALHSLDRKRGRGPFVTVNCGAISAGLAESEFFGHRRGAFTGAEHERKGLVRSAEGGVLFLDEIAELDVALQTKLLRVLQENRVLGVGEDREVEVSVRVVAASNRDLEVMMKQNKFRADLFHRLNVLSIQVLPLRDRPDDLAPLVQHFLQKYQSLTPSGALAAGRDFLEALRQIALPGNVRQLENLVCQALVHKTTDLPLSISDLPIEILVQLSGTEEKPVARKPDADFSDSQSLVNSVVRVLDANDWNLARSLESCERYALETAMERMRGNQSQTARLLGITARSVYNKVRKYQLKS
jgi:DNA-binding NtrC family response regulator